MYVEMIFCEKKELTARPSLALSILKMVSKSACLALIIPVLLIIYLLNVSYNTPLRKIRGPFLGQFTRLWKVGTILRVRQELAMIELHKKYGVCE